MTFSYSSPFPSTTSRGGSGRIRLPSSLLILCTMLWLPYILAAPTSTTSTTGTATKTTSSTSTSAATTTPSGTPTLSMLDPPTLTACSPYRVQWQLQNEDASQQKMTLQVVNIEVPQSIPPASSTSSSSSSSTSTSTPSKAAATTPSSAKATTSTTAATSRAVTPPRARSVPEHRLESRAEDINRTIVIQSANVGYTWTVDVPQGRYFLFGKIGDDHGTMAHSDIFTVLESSNTSCIVGSSAKDASTSQALPSSSASPSASVGAGGAAGGSSESSSGGISGGTIAGIVVGALAVIALIAGFFIWRKRRNNKRAMMYVGGEKPDLGSDSSNHGHGFGPGHNARGIALGSMNTDGSSSTVEKDQRHSSSLASDSAHGHEHDHSAPILLGGGGGAAAGALAQRERPHWNHNNQGTPPSARHGNPFAASPDTPNSDDAYGGYVNATAAPTPSKTIDDSHPPHTAPSVPLNMHLPPSATSKVGGSYLDFDEPPSGSSLDVFDSYDPSARRASDLPPGATHLPGRGHPQGASHDVPKSRSFSQPSEGRPSPLKHNDSTTSSNASGSGTVTPTARASPPLRSGSLSGSPAALASGGLGNGVARSGSKRRKPVPSLGPELRGQMQREEHSRRTSLGGAPTLPPLPSGNSPPGSAGLFGSSPGTAGSPRKSYQIMPDPPLDPGR